MKKKPTVINSFQQLNKVLNTEIKYEPISGESYDGIGIDGMHIDECTQWEKVKPSSFNKMNFTEFQVQLRCYLIIKDGFDNEWMQDFYSDFIEDYKAGYYDTVKEWAEMFFQEVTLDTHSYCLVTKLSPTVKREPTGANDRPYLIERCIGYVNDQTNALLKIQMLIESESDNWKDVKDLAKDYPQKNLDIKKPVTEIKRVSLLANSKRRY